MFFKLMLFAASVLAAPVHSHGSAFSWSSVSHILAFGDSYTYVQGTAGRQNYSFIGDAFNYSYTPERLLSDTIAQNQIETSAGGPNWMEYLTGCYEGLPAECTNIVNGTQQKPLWNFAFAGADISNLYLPLHHNYSVDLDRQIHQWNKYARPYLPVNPSDGLAVVWIGINDVGDSAHNASISSFPAFYANITSTLFYSAASIATAGYKSFLFMSLPPLDRTPGNVANAAAGKPLSPNTTQISQYNAALAKGADRFAKQHGVQTFVFDSYSFLGSVIDDAASYGIKNTTGYCPNYDAPDISTNYSIYGCLPIPEYFWYNTGHVTYYVHQILAAEVTKFLQSHS